jgi:peptide/nickel transport system permease protein
LSAFAMRRLLGVVAVVVVAPSLAFVVLGSLRDGTALWTQVSRLPGYLSRTFLHFDLGYSGLYQKPLGQVVLDGLPVDIALIAGGLVLGVVIGVTAGVLAGAGRRRAVDRALTIGSAAALSVPVYWFGFAVLALFAPQSGYVARIPFVSWYGGYAPLTADPLPWLQSLWVPWLVVAAPLAAMCSGRAGAHTAARRRAGARPRGRRADLGRHAAGRPHARAA